MREPDDEAHLQRRLLDLCARADSPVRVQVWAPFTNHLRHLQLGDREYVNVHRHALNESFARMKVSFELNLSLGNVVLELMEVEHFDSSRLLQRLAEVAPKLDDDELEASVRELRARQDFRDIEASWRAIQLLVSASCDNVFFAIFNCSKADFIGDMEDSLGRPLRSGLGSCISLYAHRGAAPSLLTILGFSLDARQAEEVAVLKQVAFVAEYFKSPIVVGGVVHGDELETAEAEPLRSFRRSLEARWVALAAPDWVARPADASGPSLLASGAYLVGLRFVESMAEHGSAQLQGELQGVELHEDSSVLRRDLPDTLARVGGYCIFTRQGDAVRLRTDANCHLSQPVWTSFTITLFVARLAQQIMNIDALHGLRGRELPEIQDELPRILTARLQNVTDVAINVDDCWYKQDDDLQYFTVVLSLGFAARFTGAPLHHVEKLRIVVS